MIRVERHWHCNTCPWEGKLECFTSCRIDKEALDEKGRAACLVEMDEEKENSYEED